MVRVEGGVRTNTQKPGYIRNQESMTDHRLYLKQGRTVYRSVEVVVLIPVPWQWSLAADGMHDKYRHQEQAW